LNVPGPEIGQQTEGIGYDFIPRVFDRSVVDEWIKGSDKDSFIMARRLMREEGFMCGGSSGTAMWAAVKYIKENKIGKDKTVVVVLPDNIRNYMTKHLNNDWMYEHGYITEE
jgi:cystathionine beta-synthase